MKIFHRYIKPGLYMVSISTSLFISCSKENPNNLPSVSPSDYAGKIEGFDSSDQVASANLIAYWSFDGNENELKSGTAPTSTSNDSYIDKGVRGKAVSLNSGYLYYAKQLPQFANNLQSFTVLEWVQIQNNGSTPTLAFTLARPGQFWGNINLLLETGQHPSSDVNDLVIHPDYADKNGGTQDNLNASWLSSYSSPTIGMDKWVQVGVTYDYGSNTIQVWANGRMIGAPDYQQRGSATFKLTVPNEVIIGGWYNNIPGKAVSTDTWTVPMVGNVDEIRVYNTALGAADIKALYELGAAGK
ncbi:MAG TPA: LamG-like jellyroll fold domain-containing protein [Flavisolibacter sp.]|nr:LamG-like jellyroll fold domain-containing protein [Flavisolibacter sp.]